MTRLICLLLFGCLLVHSNALTLGENPQQCQEFYYVQSGDSCESIAFSFDLNITDVQKTYECGELAVGDTICVSDIFTCQKRHMIRAGDSCDSLQQIYKVNHTEFEHLNPEVSCNGTLPVGKSFCVWGAHDRRLSRMSCTERRIIDTDDLGCYDVAEDIGMTVDEFRFLNPHLDCSGDTILPQTSVCVKGKSSVTCSQIDLVDFNKTCADYYRHYSMTLAQLLTLNPTLRCESIQDTEQICAGVGPFKNTECVETVRIAKANQNCSALERTTLLTMDQIKTMNPTIDCTQNFELSTVACTTWLGMDTRVAQNTIVSSFQDTEPELVRKHIAYRKVRNAQNAYTLHFHITEMLIRPDINAQMNQMYSDNSTVTTIVDNQFPLPRSHYCDLTKKGNTSEDVQSCYCGTDELLTYCQSLAQQEFINNGGIDYDDGDDAGTTDSTNVFSTISNRYTRSTNPNLRAVRRKREVEEGCEIFDTKSIVTYGELAGNVIGAECHIPIDIIDIDMEFGFAVPFVVLANELIEDCSVDGAYCKTANDWDVIGIKTIAEQSDEAALDLCIIGTDWLDVFHKAGAGICFEVVKIEYKPVVGTMDISMSLSFVVFKLTGGVVIDLHKMALPSMCNMAEFQCDDYCKFAYNDYTSTKSFGYMELRLFSIFGLPGIEIKHHDFNDPKKLGCEDGKEAAVVVRNGRTCEDPSHNTVTWNCWSDDGQQKSGTLQNLHDFDGMEFQPRGDTRYQCTITDSYGEAHTLEVYGGSSGNNGKKTFNFAVLDDGLYFGNVGYKESTQLMTWKQPCSTDPSLSKSNGPTAPTRGPCTWQPHGPISAHAAVITIRNERTCKSHKARTLTIHNFYDPDSGDQMINPGEQAQWHFATHKHTVVTVQAQDGLGNKPLEFNTYDVNTHIACSCPKEYYFIIRNEGVYYTDVNCASDSVLLENPLGSFEVKCDDEYFNDKLAPTGVSTVPAAQCGKNVLGYYTGWGESEISVSQLHKLTHVVFTQLMVHEDGSVGFGNADEAGDNSTQSPIKSIMRWRSLVENARGATSGIRIMIRIGGTRDIANLQNVASGATLGNFENSIQAFITAHGIDGVELGLHTGALTSSHMSMVSQLKSTLGSSKTLSVAITGDTDKIDFDALRYIHSYADIISVMTNDLFTGNNTGPPSPLFPSNSSEASLTRNVDYVMRKIVCKTGVSGKFHFTLPFYGRVWKDVEHIGNSSLLYNSGEQGGLVGWKNLENHGFNLDVAQFDDETKLPYVYNNAAKTFLGFENEQSVREKISYAANMGHRGVTAWAMDLDDEADTLLDLVSSSKEFCAPKQSQSYNCDGI